MASYDEAVPPGQAGKVKAVLKTAGYRGALEKAVTLTTNDPARKQVQLKVRAQIVGSVVLFPRGKLVLGGGAVGQSRTRLLVRKDETEDGTLELSDLNVSVPWIEARARKVGATEPAAEALPEALAGDWVIDLELVGKPPTGASRPNLRFRTGLSREKEVDIPVAVFIPPALRLLPARMSLPEPKPGEPATGTMTVTIRPDLKGEPPQVSAEPGDFHVTLEPVGPLAYRAVVSLEASEGDFPRQGSLTFLLGDETATAMIRVGSAPFQFPRPKLRPKPSPSPAAAR